MTIFCSTLENRKLSSSESEEEEANEVFKPPPQPPRKLLSAFTQRNNTRPSPVTTPVRPPLQTSRDTPLIETSNARHDGLFVRVLAVLEHIKDTLNVHGRMPQTLLRQQNKTYSAPSLPEGAAFPLKTVEDVQAVEQK